MKNPKHLTAALGAISLLALGAPALQADTIVIDDFNEDFGIQSDDHFVQGSMIGGETDYIRVGSVSFSVTDGILRVSGSSGTLDLAYDGEDASTTHTPDGLGGVDLTSGGSNDKIEIEVTSVESGPVDVTVELYTGIDSGSVLEIEGVNGPGVLEFPFDSFTEAPFSSGPADLSSVGEIVIEIDTGGDGATVEIASIRVPGAAVDAPDTIRPTLKFLKKKNLKKPRPRHNIRGKAKDNDEVKKVQARVPGKGWRKAKLKKKSGRFKFRTSRLKKKNTRIKFRAEDASGNRSKIKKVRVKGLDPAGKFLPGGGGRGGRG